jgi:hypothetical protein
MRLEAMGKAKSAENAFDGQRNKKPSYERAGPL